jgi:hypothetical protein
MLGSHPTHVLLDLYVPWLAFAYGAMMLVVLSQPKLMAIAEQRLPPPLLAQFRAHQKLAWICLLVGSIWLLQSAWLGA